MKERVKQILKQGEGRTVEFKKSSYALNDDLYETVCAFLNRDGGDILLGVADDGTLEGVNRDCAEGMRRDFANTVNNPQKLNPPCYLTLTPVVYRRKLLFHVYVPPSSQVHRCAGRIYDRNEDGDYDITDTQELVADLYARKQSSYSENTLYPYAELADLDTKLIDRVRRMTARRQENHPWATMGDVELLQSARLYQRDLQKGNEGLTLAAILLLGKETTILSAVSHHRTDAILRRVNVDRYDDRDDIRTNLLDSYDRLIAFGEKHLPDPFYLEGDQRVSLRGRILREVVGNLLIHREYVNPFPAKFIIEQGQLVTENANKPHGHGPINPALFSPYPKNPVIARVFKEIGLADELGSDVRNLYKYGKAYGGSDPELLENDIFRIVVSVPDDGGVTVGEKFGEKFGENNPTLTRESFHQCSRNRICNRYYATRRRKAD
jgi:ATP-dependent DNA helicase RecG